MTHCSSQEKHLLLRERVNPHEMSRKGAFYPATHHCAVVRRTEQFRITSQQNPRGRVSRYHKKMRDQPRRSRGDTCSHSLLPPRHVGERVRITHFHWRAVRRAGRYCSSARKGWYPGAGTRKRRYSSFSLSSRHRRIITTTCTTCTMSTSAW